MNLLVVSCHLTVSKDNFACSFLPSSAIKGSGNMTPMFVPSMFKCMSLL